MENYIIIGIILIIVAAALGYVIKAKKSGKKCIGCPSGSSCSKKSGNSPCCCCNEKHD